VQTKPYNAKVHLLALTILAVTFPLIFMGGLVTSHHAGMSVPDWPNTWGYNLFTFPISKWVGGIYYEHTHRLVAALVGFFSILLVVVAFVTDRRWWVRGNSLGILFGVCLQGFIGGERVIKNMLDLAILHGCVAQIFFCYVAAFVTLTSRWMSSQSQPDLEDRAQSQRTAKISAMAIGLILIQLIVGAIMRHSNAGLAIPDFPTAYGKILPPTAIDNSFREAAIHKYGAQLDLNRVTLFQIWIHFAHRIGAVLVTTAVLWLSISILRRHAGNIRLRRPAWLLLLLIPTQVTLGIYTVLLRKPADIASLHVAVGALILATAWITLVRAWAIGRLGIVEIARQTEHYPLQATTA
jgi:heme a synthase